MTERDTAGNEIKPLQLCCGKQTTSGYCPVHTPISERLGDVPPAFTESVAKNRELLEKLADSCPTCGAKDHDRPNCLTPGLHYSPGDCKPCPDSWHGESHTEHGMYFQGESTEDTEHGMSAKELAGQFGKFFQPAPPEDTGESGPASPDDLEKEWMAQTQWLDWTNFLQAKVLALRSEVTRLNEQLRNCGKENCMGHRVEGCATWVREERLLAAEAKVKELLECGKQCEEGKAFWKARAEAAEAKVKEMSEALREAEKQIEYLHGKFKETGTGNAVLVKIRRAVGEQGQ